MQLHFHYIFVVFTLLSHVLAQPQDTATAQQQQFDYRPGRYVPDIHGAHLGKYMPDYRGLYQHIKVPYDGGYGDRGLQYEHNIRDILSRAGAPFELGPKDHLRFMIDFNYNGTGWQVIQFEWIRDGDEERQYNYVNQNRLWEVGKSSSGNAAENDYGNVEDTETRNSEKHLNEEHYDRSFSNNDQPTTQDDSEIKDVIAQILAYFQTNILPNLV